MIIKNKNGRNFQFTKFSNRFIGGPLFRWSVPDKAPAPKRRKFLTLTVANTKLPVILSHRRSNTVSLETYPFIFGR